MALYNQSIKEDFLNEIPYENKPPYERVLTIVADTENIVDRDLYTFSLDEIKDVIYSINPQTPGSSRNVGSTIKKYIDWAIGKGYSNSNINPLSGIKTDWYNQFVDFTKKLFINDNELFEIEEGLINGQDVAPIRLLFEGVYGEGMSELLNLKISDVKDNTIRLYDDNKGERFLEVSDRCISLIHEAHNQPKYYNKNGMADNPRRTTSELVQSDYIVKTSRTGAYGKDRADKHVLYRRLTLISELENMPYLTAKNVWKSGQIKMAADILKKKIEDGQIPVLETEDYHKVAERFNITKHKMGDYEGYNVTQMKDYINSRTLKELYNIDVKI